MKQLFFILALTVGMTACQKEEVSKEINATTTTPTVPVVVVPPPVVPVIVTPPPVELTLLLSGTFTSSNSYTTTGSVKVYEDKSKKRTLVFENFKTNSGPDLKIYIAEDNAVTNFVQITDKVNTNGSYSLPIPDNVDFKKQNTVVIWCKSFSRSFGSAILK